MLTDRFDGGAAPKPLPLAAAEARGELLRAWLGRFAVHTQRDSEGPDF
jgi:hypothetical protein